MRINFKSTVLIFATVLLLSAMSEALASTKKDRSNSCEKLFQKYGTQWQKLWALRSTKTLLDQDAKGLSIIADMTKAHCSEDLSRQQFLSLLSTLSNQHTGRVGVILPVGTNPLAKFILSGIEAGVREENLDPTTFLVVLDSSLYKSSDEALAELLFKYQVSVVMGGFDSKDLPSLVAWSQRLLFPLVALNQPEPVFTPTPQVFYAHPSAILMGRALAQANKRYRHRKVSLMSPGTRASDQITRAYEIAAKDEGIEILHKVTYNPKRIDQMESAARKIFSLAPNDRTEELKNLYITAKKEAEQKKIPFNPKMISLSPIVSQDAVMILDQFKNVRHLMKVFSFLGVNKLPAFGHSEWRSSGLVTPWDPLLTGSYFVDYVGSYQQLPKSLGHLSGSQPYFVEDQKIDEIDFSLIGLRAIRSISMMASDPKVFRRKLHERVKRLVPGASPSSDAALPFDSQGLIAWPYTLFEVTSQGTTGSLSIRP